MISLTTGNLLEANVEALVNTVNCVGIMGKGIALQSKKAFPDNYEAYARACKAGEVVPGKMLVFETERMLNPKYIISFPTKRHWMGRSRYEDIESGLQALARELRERKIRSVAVPPLGCGNGGLDWRIVRPMIERSLRNMPDVKVHLYEPKGAPEAATMPVGTREPKMTIARALLIKLMEQYNSLGYRLTLLEVQKLAYFLQESKQNLRLNYVKHTYGPYAHNLNKVLEILEGHYIRGYGDNQKPDVEIELWHDAVAKADKYMDEYPETKERLAKVADLVKGFETPYGMELLASVHWIVEHAGAASDVDGVVNQMRCWNERKSRIFKPEHIRIAWNRLESQGWIKSLSLAGH
jgi:O-acetyl-ADP-ribose deacetylase (regulator of RNase III)